MKIELTTEQAEEVALEWISAQQAVPEGYKKVMDTLLMGAHFAKWSWFDAIQYAVTKCGRAYNTGTHWITDNLDKA